MAVVEDIYNFLPLSPQIATAGQPTEEELAAVKGEGYEVVVNLLPATSPNALPNESEIVTALGLEYIPIPVDWQNPQSSDLERFFDVLDAQYERRVFVHCAANMRVSVFMYLYRVRRQHMDPTEAAPALHRIWLPNATWQSFMERFVLGA